jgi:hypothetical protein
MKNGKKSGKVDLSKFAKLDKNQLGSTIGGADSTPPPPPIDPDRCHKPITIVRE